MDEMYRTLRAARKNAIKAHIKEQRHHVIFREVGLWRIKPVEEIAEIDQKAIYGWTRSKWYEMLHHGQTSEEWRREAPYGDDADIMRQFYRGECYYSPENVAYYPKRVSLKLRNRYTPQEIKENVLHGQRFD